MTRKSMMNLFGMNDAEFDAMVGKAIETLGDIIDEYGNKLEKKVPETYSASLKEVFNDGKLVKKSEKEYINGECTKDEEFDATKSIDTQNTCDCDSKKCECNGSKSNALRRKIEKLSNRNAEMASQIEDMTRYIDKMNTKLSELEKRNSELEAVINNVKNCF